MDPAESKSTSPSRRFGYGAPTPQFLSTSTNEIVGHLTRRSSFDVDMAQVGAWTASIEVLRRSLVRWPEKGHLFLEFDIPRLGRRIDAVVVLGQAIFVIEFKVGAKAFATADLDQVVDYALDLKHFHETSHDVPMFPVLVATEARAGTIEVGSDSAVPGLFRPIRCSAETLAPSLATALELVSSP